MTAIAFAAGFFLGACLTFVGVYIWSIWSME